MQIEKQGNLFLNAKIYHGFPSRMCEENKDTKLLRGERHLVRMRELSRWSKRGFYVCEMLCVTPFPTTEVDFSQKCGGGGTVLKTNDATFKHLLNRIALSK